MEAIIQVWSCFQHMYSSRNQSQYSYSKEGKYLEQLSFPNTFILCTLVPYFPGRSSWKQAWWFHPHLWVWRLHRQSLILPRIQPQKMFLSNQLHRPQVESSCSNWSFAFLQQTYILPWESAICWLQLGLSHLLLKFADMKAGLLDRAKLIFFFLTKVLGIQLLRAWLPATNAHPP